MSSTGVRSNEATAGPSVGNVDLKLELITIPVSDVDRAKAFYAGLGWRLDADFPVSESFRIVQFTPPGSGCSIAFGVGVSTAMPGSARGIELIVSDIDAARDELLARGVESVDIFHGSPFDKAKQVPGPDPERASYKTYGSFQDPDGNEWLLQEITTRLPGRVAGGSTYVSVNDLAGALRRAEAAHGEHEKRTGEADPDWPDWYAAYMIAEQSGADLPT